MHAILVGKKETNADSGPGRRRRSQARRQRRSHNKVAEQVMHVDTGKREVHVGRRAKNSRNTCCVSPMEGKARFVGATVKKGK